MQGSRSIRPTIWVQVAKYCWRAHCDDPINGDFFLEGVDLKGNSLLGECKRQGATPRSACTCLCTLFLKKGSS
jgi:hypothetical protein